MVFPKILLLYTQIAPWRHHRQNTHICNFGGVHRPRDTASASVRFEITSERIIVWQGYILEFEMIFYFVQVD